MQTELHSIVIDADTGNRLEMAEFLASHGVEVRQTLPDLEGLAALLGPEGPQIVVVNLDPAPQESLRLLTPLITRHPQVAFFALSHTVDSNLLMDAIQVGVRQFVPLPIDEERFIAGIERVRQMQAAGVAARLIHLMPATGGSGATTVACNIATALARGGKTVLVDLDLVCGTVAAAFDLQPKFTIADLMDPAEKLDRQMLDRALCVHPQSGVSVLARPDNPEDARRITEKGMSRLLDVLGRSFDYLVIDSPMSLDGIYSVVLRRSDLNVIVTQLNVPSARNAQRFMAAMHRMGVAGDRIRVVANRCAKRGNEVEPEQIERTLSMKIAWLIPNDFKNTISAVNYGEPVILRSPKAEVSQSLGALAKQLNGRAPIQATK